VKRPLVAGRVIEAACPHLFLHPEGVRRSDKAPTSVVARGAVSGGGEQQTRSLTHFCQSGTIPAMVFGHVFGGFPATTQRLCDWARSELAETAQRDGATSIRAMT
jgi:hypothetical protein